MHTLIPIELLPYLQSVAITETKGSLDELVTFNYMYIVYTIYFKYRTFLKKSFMLDIMSFCDLIEFNPYKIVSGLD
jgi:hypothetical protein